jgi:Transposase and inactivated derivatives
LHPWPFDRLYQYLEYEAEEHGIDVVNENERNTSKTSSKCGDEQKSNRVERGLYLCSSCGMVGNADCNGTENMWQKITLSPHGEHRSNECVAQSSVHLFDRESETFTTREQTVS